DQIRQFEEQIQSLSKWKQFDEYAAKNPAWKQHVEELWQKRELASNPDIDLEDPMAQAIAQMKEQVLSELNPLKEFVTQLRNEREQEKIKSDDAILTNEIKSIRDKYSDLDFDELDPAT